MVGSAPHESCACLPCPFKSSSSSVSQAAENPGTLTFVVRCSPCLPARCRRQKKHLSVNINHVISYHIISCPCKVRRQADHGRCEVSSCIRMGWLSGSSCRVEYNVLRCRCSCISSLVRYVAVSASREHLLKALGKISRGFFSLIHIIHIIRPYPRRNNYTPRPPIRSMSIR